jgi:tRNA (guanine10-N2)-methyltransferase
MKQYGVGSHFLDALVSDFSQPLWRSNMQLDAIITDRKF